MTNNRHISEDELGYRLQVVGKHLEVTGPLKDYIIEKLAKIERLTDQIIDVHVNIEVQKLANLVNIVLKFTHFNIVAHAQTDDMYAAIDKAFDRLQRKLYKWKTRIQEYHQKKPVFVDVPVSVYEGYDDEIEEFNAEIEEQNAMRIAQEQGLPKVVSQETIPLKTLRTDEALMKMTLSNAPFLVYKDEVHQELRVIYKRDNGSFGVITPVA